MDALLGRFFSQKRSDLITSTEDGAWRCSFGRQRGFDVELFGFRVVRSPIWLSLLIRLLGVCLSGCSWPATDHVDPSAQYSVTTVSHRELEDLPRVPRIVVSGELPVPLEDIWLIAGDVSTASSNRIRQGDVPEIVEGNRVPLASWMQEQERVLMPLQLLDAGQTYSLVVLGVGRLAEMATDDDPVALWRRMGIGPARAGGVVVYCLAKPPWAIQDLGTEPSLQLPDVVELGPGRLLARVAGGIAGGVGESSCLSIHIPEGRTDPLLPPHRVAGAWFEPTPLLVGKEVQESGPMEISLSVEGSSLWASVPEGLFGFVVGETASEQSRRRLILWQHDTPTRLSLGTLPAGVHRVEVAWMGPNGVASSREEAIVVAEETGQIVMTEVLANPLGPEPASEWVEVQNIGRAPVWLDEYSLEDNRSSRQLPPLLLEAGQYGVIVSEEYRPQKELDVVPDADAVPVVLSQLGHSGLLNSGEALQLTDTDGRVVSRIPALATSAGVSWARLHPLAPDVEGSFAEHADPGSSPGSENKWD